ncbi:hypothetical protein HNQ87_002227 [Pacificimonas flava]|uniref:Uncharacterized protein n=1 Tax=Pacificimonas flava TaxID=1234595 RepID=M2U7J8_9SPHN|nr:hypothetical protein C725_0945 [Pacificimonas flava]MBB5281054.1 hypothetical protein [Pacificimonas flava]
MVSAVIRAADRRRTIPPVIIDGFRLPLDPCLRRGDERFG